VADIDSGLNTGPKPTVPLTCNTACLALPTTGAPLTVTPPNESERVVTTTSNSQQNETLARRNRRQGPP